MKKIIKSEMVDFPFDSTEYKDTNEGGMYVMLVGFENKLNKYCPSGNTVLIRSDELTGIDKIKFPKTSSDLEKIYAMEKYEEEIFPYINDKFKDGLSRYCSIPFKFALNIGSTNWSGLSDKGHWFCEYKDLTYVGKYFYDGIKESYKDCELFLITFLNT